MNLNMVFRTIGKVTVLLAACLLLPLVVALVEGESDCALIFALTAVGSLVVGFTLSFLCRKGSDTIFAKEGFAIVGLVWILMSAIGALPFTLSGAIPSYVDAFFETVSGFTTTGATILNDVEILPKSMLFWRSFTHWIGGMGILVFIMALVSGFSDRSIHIMRAEMPGPVIGKLLPRAKDTAKILYMIYIVLTLLETVLLLFGGMPLFDALVHSFGTAGTGGFGIYNASIAAYNSYCQWVIAVFMLLFGVNFNLYFLILVRRFRAAFGSRELWCYLGIILVATGMIFINLLKAFQNLPLGDTVRNAFFQTVSYMTTTGYSTMNANDWPGLSKGILVLLMFVGGCAGSTAGGLKMSRLMMLLKLIAREFKRMLHPHTVKTINMEGKPVEESTLNSVGVYFAVYMVCILAIFLVVSFEPFGFEANFTATVSCFNNIGPLFGKISNFAGYSVFSKLVFSFAMLLGRLEIFPILLALMPSTWIRK